MILWALRPKSLDDYLLISRGLLLKNKKKKLYFLISRETPYPPGFWKILKAPRKAGIKNEITPRPATFFGHHLLENGPDLRSVRRCSDTPIFLRPRFTPISPGKN